MLSPLANIKSFPVTFMLEGEVVGGKECLKIEPPSALHRGCRISSSAQLPPADALCSLHLSHMLLMTEAPSVPLMEGQKH